MTKSLTFHDTQFEIVDHNGQPWLRGFQIGSALGYKNPSADMAKLYERNADEFTDQMTALIELHTSGGKQQVRIFSLRGAHLLAMLSRTKVAKEFRRWVLDILEGITAAPALPPPAPLGPFARVIGEPLRPGCPWMVMLDPRGNEYYLPYPRSTLPLGELIQQIRAHDAYGSNRELAALAAVCNERLSRRLEDQARQMGFL